MRVKPNINCSLDCGEWADDVARQSVYRFRAFTNLCNFCVCDARLPIISVDWVWSEWFMFHSNSDDHRRTQDFTMEGVRYVGGRARGPGRRKSPVEPRGKAPVGASGGLSPRTWSKMSN